MKLLAKLFFRGLAAVLPLALTAYALYVSVTWVESGLRALLLRFVDPDDYWPGMGFLLSVALVLLVGLLMYSFVVRQVYSRFTRLLERIPLVKSVYGVVVDVVRLVGRPEDRPFQNVVLVTLDAGFQQIGFLTREDFTDVPGIDDAMVAVYLPMSYQLGGFTIVLPRSRVRPLAMTGAEALRFCVTAGVARKAPPGAAAPRAEPTGSVPR